MTIAIRNASYDSVGVVKIGSGLSISEDGVLSIGGKDMYDMLITKFNFDAKPLTRNQNYMIFPIAGAPAVTPTYYNRTNDVIKLQYDRVRVELRPGGTYKIDETYMLIARIDTTMSEQEFIGFCPFCIQYDPNNENIINTSPYTAGASYSAPKWAIIKGLNGNTSNFGDDDYTYSNTYSTVFYNKSRFVDYLYITPGANVISDSQETITKYSGNIGGYYSLVVTKLGSGDFTTSYPPPNTSK